MKIKDITQKDIESLCEKHLNKLHCCSGCPLFKTHSTPIKDAGGIVTYRSYCGVIRLKWELESKLKRVQEDYELIEDEEIEL